MNDVHDSEPACPAVLAEVTRGEVVESRHRGHLAVVTGTGSLVAQVGDPAVLVYPRSSMKPFQALPLLTSGAADRFGFTEREVAIACGSHGGEPMHTETVLGMLQKIRLEPDDLQCGTHEPYDPDARRALQERGERPGPLHNNCSGKHAGMLALACHLGARPEGYLGLDHPVQRAIRRQVVRFSGAREEELPAATDGCSAPIYALPLRALALMFARLAAPPPDYDDATRAACRRIAHAMRSFPEMVDGTAEGESLDSAVMRSARLPVVSKVGAEGVYAAAVLPCPAWPDGLGLAFKLEDGDATGRARPPVAVELLRRLGVLDLDAQPALQPYARAPVTNHRGDPVGEVRPAGMEAAGG